MKKLILLAVFISFVFINNTYAQSNDTVINKEDDEDAVLKITTLNINLPVTVFDEKGRFVADLKKENFQVLENKETQPIIEFHSQANLPLNVAVLMDTSTSVRNKLEFERTAIKQFLASVLRTEKDKISFITFDSTVSIRNDFTNDLSQVSKTVDDIKVATGQTSLYDAIYKVCRESMPRTTSRRRVLVVVTDGADTNSSHTLAQTIALAQKTETTIYALSTKGGSVFRVEGSPYLNSDDRELKKLCRDTGGEVFFPDNVEALTKAFRQVTDFLRNQYVIVYEPINSDDGKFRQIEVRILGKKNLSTITRQGYLSK
jgi:Ca-activated chloride channel family protein